jgi:glycosyltransferase involved in cell wall biosynthesis
MWPLTGGCAYAYECEKFMIGCPSPCPREAEYQRLMDEPTDREWLARERFFASPARRIALVAPSRWMAGCARRRFGERLRVEVVPNGLDTDVFRPIGDRAVARQALGLPLETGIALAGVDYLPDPRKGMDRLEAAWPRVRAALGERCRLVVFGAAGGGRSLPADWLTVGRVRDERLLNLFYNAADVYVLPSLADNLPNTLVESVAAGTPCVAFDVGGCGEVVRPGRTGYLAANLTSESLAEALLAALQATPEERRRVSASCREVALGEYRLDLQARRYLALFGELEVAAGTQSRR